MPTIPRKWPLEAEPERQQALHEAEATTTCLRAAQETIDAARARRCNNRDLVLVLLTDAERQIADALSGLERVLRFLAAARACALGGRWPIGAARQRDDSTELAEAAAALLVQAADLLAQTCTHVHTNPVLTELQIVDAARTLARGRTLVERIARLLTEAAIGRD